jgi:hypothetical protein
MSSNSLAYRVDRLDDTLELGALAAQLLRTLRLAPDGRVFEFAQDLGQSFGFARIVKGTP